MSCFCQHQNRDTIVQRFLHSPILVYQWGGGDDRPTWQPVGEKLLGYLLNNWGGNLHLMACLPLLACLPLVAIAKCGYFPPIIEKIQILNENCTLHGGGMQAEPGHKKMKVGRCICTAPLFYTSRLRLTHPPTARNTQNAIRTLLVCAVQLTGQNLNDHEGVGVGAVDVNRIALWQPARGEAAGNRVVTVALPQRNLG